MVQNIYISYLLSVLEDLKRKGIDVPIDAYDLQGDTVSPSVVNRVVEVLTRFCQFNDILATGKSEHTVDILGVPRMLPFESEVREDSIADFSMDANMIALYREMEQITGTSTGEDSYSPDDDEEIDLFSDFDDEEDLDLFSEDEGTPIVPTEPSVPATESDTETSDESVAADDLFSDGGMTFDFLTTMFAEESDTGTESESVPETDTNTADKTADESADKTTDDTVDTADDDSSADDSEDADDSSGDDEDAMFAPVGGSDTSTSGDMFSNFFGGSGDVQGTDAEEGSEQDDEQDDEEDEEDDGFVMPEPARSSGTAHRTFSAGAVNDETLRDSDNSHDVDASNDEVSDDDSSDSDKLGNSDGITDNSSSTATDDDFSFSFGDDSDSDDEDEEEDEADDESDESSSDESDEDSDVEDSDEDEDDEDEDEEYTPDESVEVFSVSLESHAAKPVAVSSSYIDPDALCLDDDEDSEDDDEEDEDEDVSEMWDDPALRAGVSDGEDADAESDSSDTSSDDADEDVVLGTPVGTAGERRAATSTRAVATTFEDKMADTLADATDAALGAISGLFSGLGKKKSKHGDDEESPTEGE